MTETTETIATANQTLAVPGATPQLRSLGIALAGSALIAICAHVAIPLFFTPVPITLQPFAVLLLGLMLSPRDAFAATAAYLLEGACGLPVFTPHGLGGIAQLLGPTGGYLFSYPLVAPLVAWFWQRGSVQYYRACLVAGIGSLLTLAMGLGWMGVITHASLSTLVRHAVLPFLPGDVLKVASASAIAIGMRRWSRKY